jgi:hypothetical protein
VRAVALVRGEQALRRRGAFSLSLSTGVSRFGRFGGRFGVSFGFSLFLGFSFLSSTFGCGRFGAFSVSVVGTFSEPQETPRWTISGRFLLANVE